MHIFVKWRRKINLIKAQYLHYVIFMSDFLKKNSGLLPLLEVIRCVGMQRDITKLSCSFFYYQAGEGNLRPGR